MPNEIKTDEMLIWTSKLPEILERIQMNDGFTVLWTSVNKQVLSSNQDIVKVAYEDLEEKIGAIDSELELQVIMNPLQAYEIADFLCIESTKYIIISQVHIDSIVHEYLHIYFDKIIENNKHITEKYADLLKNVFDAMYKYQYASDLSKSSWNRVFEEHFVRAATIWSRMGNDLDELEKEIRLQDEIGFKYIRPIVSTFESSWSSDIDKNSFWEYCLEACRNEILKYS